METYVASPRRLPVAAHTTKPFSTAHHACLCMHAHKGLINSSPGTHRRARMWAARAAPCTSTGPTRGPRGPTTAPVLIDERGRGREGCVGWFGGLVGGGGRDERGREGGVGWCGGMGFGDRGKDEMEWCVHMLRSIALHAYLDACRRAEDGRGQLGNPGEQADGGGHGGGRVQLCMCVLWWLIGVVR